METRRKPIDEQLAHVLERTPRADPEKNEVTLILKPLECLNTYTFILTTTPKRIDVIVKRMNPVIASSGK